jgi:hypothetical protein
MSSVWHGTFKSVRDAGNWHIKIVEGKNQTKNANYKRAGRVRLSKAAFRKKLLEDLKHGE